MSAAVPRLVEARRSGGRVRHRAATPQAPLEPGGTVPYAGRAAPPEAPTETTQAPLNSSSHKGSAPTRAGPLCANCYRAGARLAFLKL